MSIKLIELQDHNLRISTPEGVLGKSPGFANTADSNPVFGQAACEKFRLYPHDSFTRFWSKLNLDPLLNSNRHFRHHADIAYAHLNELSQQHELNEELMFAVPSHYSRSELATLLGLVRHCSFKLVGLVDLPLTALAGAMTETAAGSGCYLDFQLHQAVLTHFVSRDGFLHRDAITQIPGCGLMALNDAWSSLIAEAFIKQSRFNPQHNADTEQYIFNQLPTWLAEISSGNELSLSINNKGNIYQARLNPEAFEQKTRHLYAKIQAELEKIPDADTGLYLPADMTSLPGFRNFFPDSIGLHEDSSLETVLQHASLLKSNPASLKLHTRLPLPKKAATAKAPAEALPSHVLFQHKAYPLPGNFNIKGNVAAPFEVPGITKPLNIRFEKNSYVLYPESAPALSLNGARLTTPAFLKIGDCISLDAADELIYLIQVQ